MLQPYRNHLVFLVSGLSLTNKITAYDTSSFNLFIPSWLSSYTVNGFEIQATTNWSGGTPRLSTVAYAVTQNRTYLVKMKLKPTVNNYFLKMKSLYNEGTFDTVKEISAFYNSAKYSEICYVFTADRNSSNLVTYVIDKDANNAVQNPFYVKEVSIIDVTDVSSKGYILKTLQKVLDTNYFVGAKTFS
jgi:hypothetical protein